MLDLLSHDIGFVRATLAEHHHFHTIVQDFKYLKVYITLFLLTFRLYKDVTGFVGRNSHRLFIPRVQTI